MMTVKELIEELEHYNENLPVIIGYNAIQDIQFEEDFYFADSKNPNQAFGPAVIIE